jgi:hypothetical protein
MNAIERARSLGLIPRDSGHFFTHEDRNALIEALKPLSQCRVNALPHRDVKSARSTGENRVQGVVGPLNEVLLNIFTTDAHMQVATVPELVENSCSPRFATDAIKYGAEITALVFDFDLSEHGSSRMTDELFRDIVGELSASPMLAGAVFHATRGGLRAIRPLERPFQTQTPRGSEWSAFYESVVDQLPASRYGAWDKKCSDVPRLIRLPYVLRDGEPQRPLFYVPSRVEPYALSDRDSARIIAQSTPTEAKNHGVEGDAFISFLEAIGAIKREHTEINGAPSYCVKCPYDHLHSVDHETSTVAMQTGDDKYIIHCLHASCAEFYKGAGWRRHYQDKYPELWDEHIGIGARQHIYSPDDHVGFVSSAVAILEGAFPERIFRRHDAISTVERDPYGGARWRAWSVADLTGLLNRRGQWVKQTTDREGNVTTRSTSVPERMVKIHILAISEELPECLHSSTLPPLDPETLAPTRFSEGYCAITKTYYLPPVAFDLEGLRRCCERDPSRDRAILAYSALTELYSDFPWRTKAHKALAVGITLSAGLRRSMDVSPMMLVSANTKGVGKTKLIQTALASVYGRTPPLSALPSRDEELKKVLDSLVHTDADIFVADNVASRIGGAVLDGFLTSPLHSYRPLGSTNQLIAPNRVLVCATGNNSQIGGDSDRRSILVRLVSDEEKPEQRRGFKYRDLVGEARNRHSQTWIYIIEILRAFRECATAQELEHIEQNAKPLGSYEQWCDLVRDPIMWVASLVEGQDVDLVNLSNSEVEDAREDDRSEVFDALIQWQTEQDERAKRRGAEWTAKKLFTALREAYDEGLDTYLETFAHSFPRLTLRSVSRLLGSRRDQVVSGHTLRSRKIGGTLHYYVEGSTQPAPPTQPTPPTEPAPPKPQQTRGEPLPIINEYDWRACSDSRGVEVNKELLDQTDFEKLSRRCALLRGDMCAKQKIPCEYEGSNGGLSQAHADALIATHDQHVRDLEAPQLPIDLGSTDHPRAIEITRAEFAIKSTLQKIATRLNSEGIPVPSGRKWTSSKVSGLAKRHRITKPAKQTKSKSDAIRERDGHWEGYWPAEHPTKTPSATDTADIIGASGSTEVSVKALLSRLYGREMTAKTAFEQRQRRDEVERD